MTKVKTSYNCTACGAISLQWAGQCQDCQAWNTLTEVIAQSGGHQRHTSYAGGGASELVSLSAIAVTKTQRTTTGLGELDRVLGGGLVPGSVILIGGDPGIGKSTILLQTIANLSQTQSTLYVSGEESLQQIKLRAERLQLGQQDINLLSETHVERIIKLAEQHIPQFLVIDSIQTVYTDLLQSAPGSVSQVRESAAQLVKFAKQTNTALCLVGHVTKEGQLAGPRVLEHMVDSVLYFEGRADNRFRMLRAVKNRFGAVNELGLFAMTEGGLKGVSNPSAIFLSRQEPEPGSVIMAMWEGTRPLLIEVQALVDESSLNNPRRVAVGIDQNRLSIGLAVLNRHSSVATYNQDVFVNVVGGLKVTETASDLPVMLAVHSSVKNTALPKDLIVFGEIGLNGEVRPVQNGQARLQEAVKLGFTRAIVPKENKPKTEIQNLSVEAVSHLREALNIL